MPAAETQIAGAAQLVTDKYGGGDRINIPIGMVFTGDPDNTLTKYAAFFEKWRGTA